MPSGLTRGRKPVFGSDHVQSNTRFPGRSASSEVGADRSLRQGRLRLRRHVASRLAAVPARRDMGLAGDETGRDRRIFACARVQGGQFHRHADHRHRHGSLDAADNPARGAAYGQGRTGPDADGGCHPHLQYHAGRAPARRGGVDRGAMSGAATSKESAAFCADLVRTHDFARYASTLFLPQVQRRALLAVHAFNVEISRVREQVSQPLPGEMRLQWWTDMLEGTGHGGVEGNPVAAELLQTIGEFRLPVEPWTRLIEEHQFDLYNDPMPSMAALEGYVTDTSAALFSLGARVAVQPSAVIDHLARHAGLAQGMAQVIAALPLDAARRQLFLPLQLLQQHGSGIEEVFSGKQTPRTRAAIDQLAGDARKHLGTAFELLAHVPPQVRPVFLSLALVRRDLTRLSRADVDPFVQQATSRFRTLWTMWRA